MTASAANNQQGDPTVQTYRAIYRGGSYLDVPASSAATAAETAFDRTAARTGGEPVVAVIDLDVLDGGDAYQLLAHIFADADDGALGRDYRVQE
ncbi:hypothetical protein [Tsukamurella spumae]|uniref:Uncharacterized protein n=1 Tax=Tsukamurella spumae TaxID=44753 RepID=A0A846X213_9ACTN|nr:hypothetical protein [Tsukamurella spumae]NKY19538.1 hypothetical protein [Tsukamurella spumae]